MPRIRILTCRFFDEWLPTLVFEIRRLLRGVSFAKELDEGVISKDGISRPAGKKASVDQGL